MFKASVASVLKGLEREAQVEILERLSLLGELSGLSRQEQERILASITLHNALKEVVEIDRIAILEFLGMSRERAIDHAQYISRVSEPGYLEKVLSPPPQKVKDSEARTQDMMERIKACMERAKEREGTENKEAWTTFQRHAAHNRFLLGGSSDLDDASFENPAFDQKREVARWFLNEFIPSGRRIGLLLGGTGSGKTWGCLAYLARVATVEWGVVGLKVMRTNACYITAYRISEMLEQRSKFQSKLDELRSVHLLLLDELGGEGPEFRGDNSKLSAFLENLTAHRHQFRHMKTLITSNQTLSDFTIGYGERIMSRIQDVGLITDVKEQDMRG